MNQRDEQKKKILCISVMQNWGGGEEFLLKLQKNLSDFDFVIVSPEGEARMKFIGNGIKIITNNLQKKVYRNSGWSPGAILKIIFKTGFSTFKLFGIFRQENPALVLANGLFASLYALPSVLLSSRKLIVVQHLIFNEKSIEKRIVKLVHRYSQEIVCVSKAVKDNLSSMLGKTDSYKIIVIPNGIEITEHQDLTYSYENVIRIGMIGSIIRIKGIDLVIQALNDVLKSGKAELHIYGAAANDEDSLKYEAELKNIVIKSGLENKVIFEGYIESKEKIYSQIDIAVNYSIVPESFSFSVLEAMMFKKIVIAVNSGGPKEIISDGETGFLVEPGNINQLKDKIIYCMENLGTDKFDKIRKKAHETIKNEYPIEKFREGYSKLFYSLINKTN